MSDLFTLANAPPGLRVGDPVTAIVDGRAVCGVAGAGEYVGKYTMVQWAIVDGVAARVCLDTTEGVTWCRGHDVESMKALAAAHRLRESAA